MVTSTAKAQALMRDLADHLSKRFPASAAGLNSIRQAFDANGMPEMFISHNANEAAGQPVVYVRIMQIDAVSKDVFGNSLLAYAPHKLQVAFEAGASATATIVALPDLFAVLFEATKTAVQQDIIKTANGVAVTEANVNAAAVIASLDELYWPLKNP